jgi:hypothetical protein
MHLFSNLTLSDLALASLIDLSFSCNFLGGEMQAGKILDL